VYAPKPISLDGVPGALAKAERYRLLNEPNEAESICLDILAVDPENQHALVTLVLALADQIPHSSRAFGEALAHAGRLAGDYDRAYYQGIAWERRGKARFHGGGPGAREYVYEWLSRALDYFAEAERLRAPGNDDALLRWNACVRFLQAHQELTPRPEQVADPLFLE
jgi:hypothetical protein